MPIVLKRAEWWTMPEALRRLWHRRKRRWVPSGPFVLVVVDVALLGLLSLGFLLTPPILSIVVANGGREPWRYLLAAALGLVGGNVGFRVWRRSWPFLRWLAWLLVPKGLGADQWDDVPLTDAERGAVERLRDGLRALALAMEHAGESRDALQAANSQWTNNVYNSNVLALSRSDRLLNRLALPGKILTDALVTGEDADVFAAVVKRVSTETAGVLDAMLDGRPVTSGASMWPYTYENGRSEDCRRHSGKPESLRKWLAERAAEDARLERNSPEPAG